MRTAWNDVLLGCVVAAILAGPLPRRANADGCYKYQLSNPEGTVCDCASGSCVRVFSVTIPAFAYCRQVVHGEMFGQTACNSQLGAVACNSQLGAVGNHYNCAGQVNWMTLSITVSVVFSAGVAFIAGAIACPITGGVSCVISALAFLLGIVLSLALINSCTIFYCANDPNTLTSVFRDAITDMRGVACVGA